MLQCNCVWQLLLIIGLALFALSMGFEGAFNANHELLLAAKNGNVPRIIQVINEGAYLEARNNNGVSALLLAANNGHLNAVRELLARGADIEARSNDGRTSLIWASLWGHIDVVRYLLERGAQIDAMDLSGMTALMSATLNGHVHIVRYLIEQGAEVAVVNSHGGTALSIAKIKEYKELMHILEPYFGPDETTDPHWIILEHLGTAILNAYKTILAKIRYYTGLNPTLDMEFEDL